MKSIAVITARAGSKGVPDKNIRILNGIPLMAHSINAAFDSECFQKVFVSTDSELYAKIAVEYGADVSFLRSEKNSGDNANSWDVVKEVIGTFEEKGEYFDTIMLLQPTSPMRNAEDIRNSFNLLEEKRASSVIGVTETDHSPLWCNTLPESLSMDNFRNEKYCDLPRQCLPKYYRINGAIYLLTREELDKEDLLMKNSYAYIMPRNRSIDIDTIFDFAVAECMFSKMKGEIKDARG